MRKLPKTAGLRGYYALPKRQRDAIRLMFSGDMTDEQIGKRVGRKARTIRDWRNDPRFISGQREYNYIAIKDYVPEAIATLHDIMTNSKYEMARLTAANSILKLAGMLSDNSTPELDKAKVRKANADAEIAENKAKQLRGGNASGITINFVRSRHQEDNHEETT